MPPAPDHREVLSRPAEGPDAVLRYAEHGKALTDIFLPATLGRPATAARLVVLLHGGFWRQEFDRVHLRPLANALTGRGFVVAVPDYRRIGDPGGWSATSSDVEAALSALPTSVAEIAPGYVDPADPYVLVGHSAGGHLALWAGLRAPPGQVAAIVGLAPVTDLVHAADAGLGDGAVVDLLGGHPDDVPGRYAAADVLKLLPADVPVTIIQGAEDAQVPAEMNRAVATRVPPRSHPRPADRSPASPRDVTPAPRDVTPAPTGGDNARFTYIELPGVEHFALIDPLSQVFEHTVLPALRG